MTKEQEFNRGWERVAYQLKKLGKASLIDLFDDSDDATYEYKRGVVKALYFCTKDLRDTYPDYDSAIESLYYKY